MALTVEAIARAKAPKSGSRWLSDKGSRRNEGRLVLRILAGGTKRFYFRYSAPDGKRMRIPIGPFTESARPGAFTLTEARRKAEEYAAIHRGADSRDVLAHIAKQEKLEREAREAEERRVAEEQARAAAIADSLQRYTVKELAKVYIRDLERRGKDKSAKDAANIFKNHLNDTTLAARPATEVTARDFTALLRSVVESGKGRTAAKLRSYLRAAYASAISSELNPGADSAFIGFAIQTNPLAPIDALSEFSRARDRTLTDSELASYWTRLKKVPNPAVRGALQLGLLLGGQRTAQFLRLKRTDVDLAAGWITLYDPKGARKQARPHELPINALAVEILTPLVDRAAALPSDWVFTTDGESAIYPDTVSAEATKIAIAMKKAREARDLFKLSDVRRTAETMMAAMGVSRELRAQIQSHGLAGVQQRHYDKHHYRTEKVNVLGAWAKRVISGPPPASVVPIKRKSKAK